MAAAPYMKLYVADYLGDTIHLDALEHGAYLLLLMAMWRAGGKLPTADANLAKIARCTPAQWAEIRGTILPFFKVVRGKLTHKRLTQEMAKYEDVSRKRSEAVRARVEKKANENSEEASSNDARLIAKPEPKPEPVDKKGANAPSVAPAAPAPSGGLFGEEVSAPPPRKAKSKAEKATPWKDSPEFQRLWDRCTDTMRRRCGSQEKAWPLWLEVSREVGAERLFQALVAYRAVDPDVQRTGGPGLHLWLRDRKWEIWLDHGHRSAPSGPRFPGPPDVRAAVVAAGGEKLASGYLDRCAWQEPQRAVVSASPTIIAALTREAGAVLHGMGIQLVQADPVPERASA